MRINRDCSESNRNWPYWYRNRIGGAEPVCRCIEPNRYSSTVYPGEALAQLRLSPAMPRRSPGESRQRPGRAPVYRNSIGTHRGYTSIRPRQSYGNPRFNPYRDVAGNAQAEPR
ncbi:hypothetical protein DPMN_112356 [Dreissena polymorpha]|uniref:Uncharacterized protein n=1 Tax=Dreissena polymorpha TaxID=45954 RepID=A0A9D4KGC3_DREPO|nr:hypothetical protein DPMN_112356 [Dreissena polymorpha]